MADTNNILYFPVGYEFYWGFQCYWRVQKAEIRMILRGRTYNVRQSHSIRLPVFAYRLLKVSSRSDSSQINGIVLSEMRVRHTVLHFANARTLGLPVWPRSKEES